jgi:D-arabinose 1-dehydrogenase-like Zn-dependent alcohol dehydrogenase
MAGKEYTIYKPQGDRIIEVKAQILALGPKDILIRITHSGVCNADAAFAKRGACIALGHEGVGIVEAVGSDVTQFQVGERAGGVFHRDSCSKCHYCLSGRDILCSDRVIFGAGDTENGTFGQYYIGKKNIRASDP